MDKKISIILLFASFLIPAYFEAKAFIYAPCCLSAATVSQNEIDLSWAPVAADPAVSGYTVERETPVGGGFTTIAVNISPTSYKDTGLSAGQIYNYRIYALNSTDGTSQASLPAAATTQSASAPALPGGTTNLTATAASSSEIHLSWTAASSIYAITGYRIEREAPYGSGFSTLVVNTGSSATTYADTNLSPGVSYNYRVTAFNQFGPGPVSFPASATTPKLPSELADIFATAGDGQVKISWLPPYVPGGTLTGYTINIVNSTATISVSGTTTSSTITGLKNGTHYIFSVAAINLAGTGPAKLTSEVVPAASFPVPPANVPTSIPHAPPVFAPTSSTPSSAGYIFMTYLTVGSRGQAVIELQKILAKYGFLSAQPTGYFGALTKAALSAYQKSRGMQQTGTLGPLTRATINAGK